MTFPTISKVVSLLIAANPTMTEVLYPSGVELAATVAGTTLEEIEEVLLRADTEVTSTYSGDEADSHSVLQEMVNCYQEDLGLLDDTEDDDLDQAVSYVLILGALMNDPLLAPVSAAPAYCLTPTDLEKETKPSLIEQVNMGLRMAKDSGHEGPMNVVMYGQKPGVIDLLTYHFDNAGWNITQRVISNEEVWLGFSAPGKKQ